MSQFGSRHAYFLKVLTIVSLSMSSGIAAADSFKYYNIKEFNECIDKESSKEGHSSDEEIKAKCERMIFPMQDKIIIKKPSDSGNRKSPSKKPEKKVSQLEQPKGSTVRCVISYDRNYAQCGPDTYKLDGAEKFVNNMTKLAAPQISTGNHLSEESKVETQGHSIAD